MFPRARPFILILPVSCLVTLYSSLGLCCLTVTSASLGSLDHRRTSSYPSWSSSSQVCSSVGILSVLSPPSWQPLEASSFDPFPFLYGLPGVFQVPVAQNLLIVGKVSVHNPSSYPLRPSYSAWNLFRSATSTSCLSSFRTSSKTIIFGLRLCRHLHPDLSDQKIEV